tara:strand:- start:161 stop:322 length:162 start_codon:yes stop_codon:yes gene_type:complete
MAKVSFPFSSFACQYMARERFVPFNFPGTCFTKPLCGTFIGFYLRHNSVFRAI